MWDKEGVNVRACPLDDSRGKTHEYHRLQRAPSNHEYDFEVEQNLSFRFIDYGIRNRTTCLEETVWTRSFRNCQSLFRCVTKRESSNKRPPNSSTISIASIAASSYYSLRTEAQTELRRFCSHCRRTIMC